MAVSALDATFTGGASALGPVPPVDSVGALGDPAARTLLQGFYGAKTPRDPWVQFHALDGPSPSR